MKQREEGRAGVLGRPRHLDHHPVAQGELRRGRDHRLLRRRRPGRRLRGGARKGPGDRRQQVRRRGPARGVRARLRFKALSAGAIYEDRYLLGTSLARPLLAYHQVQAALAEGADALAHGATGKGNDQVRFEVTYGAVRAAHDGHRALARVERSARARTRSTTPRKHGVPVEQTKKDLFSRDGNLWHLSHEGGNLEDAWDAPRKEMFKLTVDPLDAPDEPQLDHDRLRARRAGQLDGKRLAPVRMVETLNRVAGAHGVGRARPGREPPGRDQVARRLRDAGRHRAPHRAPRARAAGARPRHAALQAVGLGPLRPADLRRAVVLDAAPGARGLRRRDREGGHRRGAACASTRARAEAVGRRSPRSLYRQDLATFGEGMAYDHQDAEGFIRLFGLPERVRALTRSRVTVDVKAVEMTRAGAAAREKATAPAGSERHRSARLPRRRRRGGIKPDRPRPRARGRRRRRARRPAVFTTNLAQAAPVLVSRAAPGRRPGAGDRGQRGLRQRRHGRAPGSPTRARWPRSRRGARRLPAPRRWWSPRPASSACGCRWRSCARASPRPSPRSRARAGPTPRAPS